MSIDTGKFPSEPMTALPALPEVPGGWRRQSIDIGWTVVEMQGPVSPDALLETVEVQEANRRDDSMPYWATLWPAALTMAQRLDQADWPAGTEILEIGCGLGLVGIAGLKRGWKVDLTDGEEHSLAAARHNAVLNGFPRAAVFRLDWRAPSDHPYAAILACDVLYEVRHHLPILQLMEQQLVPGGRCWIGDPGRTPSAKFFHTANEQGWDVVVRDSAGELHDGPLRSEFQILELTRTGERPGSRLQQSG